MLGEPNKAEKSVQIRKDKKTGRFQILKLEERIAPHKSDDPFHKHGKGGSCSRDERLPCG